MSTIENYTFMNRPLVHDMFIETGTEDGRTLTRAASAGYKELHSIEVDPIAFQKSSERLSRLQNVTLHLGSSPKVLDKIIDRERRTTFWLDAHFQGLAVQRGEVPDSEFGECPLLAELEVIFKLPWKYLPIIIIDDHHMFIDCSERAIHTYGRIFNWAQWPTLAQIEKALGPNYLVYVSDFKIYCLPSP